VLDNLNLADARAKQNWADKRLLALGVEIGKWGHPSADPVETGEWEDHPDERYTLIPFASAKSMPDDWPLAIGDIVSNYRAALNYAASALVAAGAKPQCAGRYPVQFPIVDPSRCDAPTAASFETDGWVNKQLPGVVPEYLRAISTFQPYEGCGDRPLNALRVLSNVDKHRRPLLMAQIMVVHGSVSEVREDELGHPVSTFDLTTLASGQTPKPGTYIARLDWAPGFHPVRVGWGRLSAVVSDESEVGVYLRVTAGVALQDLGVVSAAGALWGISTTAHKILRRKGRRPKDLRWHQMTPVGTADAELENRKGRQALGGFESLSLRQYPWYIRKFSV